MSNTRIHNPFEGLTINEHGWISKKEVRVMSKKDSRGGDVDWNEWTISQLEADVHRRGKRIIEMREEMDELKDENIKLQNMIAERKAQDATAAYDDGWNAALKQVKYYVKVCTMDCG